jgi:hypothetical protein
MFFFFFAARHFHERADLLPKRGLLVKETHRTRRSQIQVPQTQSAFHLRAQRNAFRRCDVRQQSRSFFLARR